MSLWNFELATAAFLENKTNRIVRCTGWNVFTLLDGRTFHVDSDKIYEFPTSSGDTMENHPHLNSLSISPNAKEGVRINLDEVPDEELQRLGGWNVNINPYTTGAYEQGYTPRIKSAVCLPLP